MQLPQEDVAVAEAPVVISTAAPADIADLQPAAQEPAPAAAQDTCSGHTRHRARQPDAEVEAFFAEADHAEANDTFEDQDTLLHLPLWRLLLGLPRSRAAVSEDAEASDVLPTEEISSASVTPKEDKYRRKTTAHSAPLLHRTKWPKRKPTSLRTNTLMPRKPMSLLQMSKTTMRWIPSSAP